MEATNGESESAAQEILVFRLRDGTVFQSERKKLGDRFSWFLNEFCFGSGNGNPTEGEPFMDVMYCVLKNAMCVLRIAGPHVDS